MKTSTIMIITAVLVTFASLTAFNIDVKKVYQSGAYKSRFRGMDFTSLNGVNDISILTADRMSVKIEHGEKEGIWISSSEKQDVIPRVKGNTLELDLAAESKTTGFRSWADIIIITKNVAKLHLVSGDGNHDPNGYENGDIQMKGYKLNDFDLSISKFVNVNLNANTIKNLKAQVGNEKEGKARLSISSDSEINTAQFNVPGASTLQLYNPKLVKAVYNLSDSATVTLNGKVVQTIK
jgi:uncharacterized protein YdeI (BOF family)